MLWGDEVTLEAVERNVGPTGYPQEKVTETLAFADVQAVKRSEFYTARQAGVNLSITVKLRAADYSGQERLVWNGRRYQVERTYSKGGDDIELNCSDFKEAQAQGSGEE